MNIKEVARIAGVSVASVSRAFQDPPSPSISQRQRERILKLCEELHYYPDIHSRRMSRRCSNNITLFSRPADCKKCISGEDMHFDYNFAAVTMGIQQALIDCSKSLQLVYLTDKFLEERQHLKMVRSKMTDGILFWGALQDDRCVHELMEENIPLVLLCTDVANCSCCKVLADEYNGMQMVVSAALEAGHRKIALLPPPLGGSAGVARKKAIDDVLQRYNVSPVWVAPEGSFDYKSGKNMAQILLESGCSFSCVIAANDATAKGCINVLNEAGIRVPQDVSVTGADGLPFPGQLTLESFYLPAYEMGMEGAKSLAALIDGEKTAMSRILPVSYIRGNSILPAKKEQ